jgi:Bacterial dnaA protein helix-turn-helix
VLPLFFTLHRAIMGGTDEIVDFFREVQKVIKKHGLETVLTKLREIHGNNSQHGFEKDVCEYILAVTANHYKVPKEDIVRSKKRGIISEARRMCFALMKEHLPISDEEIGDIFDGRSRQFVNKELSNLPINQDNFATKDEANFVKDFLELTVMVLYFKNDYSLNKETEPPKA